MCFYVDTTATCGPLVLVPGSPRRQKSLPPTGGPGIGADAVCVARSPPWGPESMKPKSAHLQMRWTGFKRKLRQDSCFQWRIGPLQEDLQRQCFFGIWSGVRVVLCFVWARSLYREDHRSITCNPTGQRKPLSFCGEIANDSSAMLCASQASGC